MAGPYTSFVYGDPATNVGYVLPTYVQQPAGVALFLGFNGGGLGPSVTPVAVVLQGGVDGASYSETIYGKGGDAPYTFSLYSGSLPGGTSLNSSTGEISGTLSATGTFNFFIGITDAHGSYGTQQFQITIVAPALGQNANWGWVA